MPLKKPKPVKKGPIKSNAAAKTARTTRELKKKLKKRKK